MEKVRDYIYTHFCIITAVLSAILSVLYIWKGYKEHFTIDSWIIIALNLTYCPLVFIFKKNFFVYHNLVYAIVFAFVLAFTKTYLYNNCTALFLICIVCTINPNLKKIAYPLYFTTVSIAFAINEETIYHFFIHITRSLWYISVIESITYAQVPQQKLILYEDEIKILTQLSQGNIYQKEVEGFSENTVYRKIKSARERNGNISKDELMDRFKKEFSHLWS